MDIEEYSFLKRQKNDGIDIKKEEEKNNSRLIRIKNAKKKNK
jgi:hypothetical protein